MRKVFVLVMIMALVAGSLFAGGSREGAAASAAPVRAQIVNVASTFPTGSPQDAGLVEFKRLLEQRSNGRYEVIIHAGGSMGNEWETFEQLVDGSVEIGANGSGDISAFFPAYFVMEVPYVFNSVDQFWKYWNGPLGREINELIEKERGVKTAGVVLRGARYLTSNRPVRSVADVRGLKIRLPQVQSWVRVWEHLGALPTPINFSEVYLALQTGTVEAQENPPETILNYKFYEVQRYLIKTEHVYSAARYLISNIWLNRQSATDQQMILQAMKEATDFANNLTREGDAQFVKRLVEEHGMELIVVDQAAFQQAVQPVLQQLATEWRPGILQQLRQM